MRDARLKLVALLAALIAISFTRSQIAFAVYSLALISLALIARISLQKLSRNAPGVALFFAGIFLALLASGQAARALDFLEKAFLSAFASLLFISTTNIDALVRALAFFRVPAPLLLVIQFLHRYLWVISDQARRMRQAAASRGGFRFSAAAGALGVLFVRAWQRADNVYAAMLARGFDGNFPR